MLSAQILTELGDTPSVEPIRPLLALVQKGVPLNTNEARVITKYADDHIHKKSQTGLFRKLFASRFTGIVFPSYFMHAFNGY